MPKRSSLDPTVAAEAKSPRPGSSTQAPASYLMTPKHLNKLLLWDPQYFTDPQSIPEANRAPIRGSFRFIVRAMGNACAGLDRFFGLAPASNSLTRLDGMECVSASVINETKSKTFKPFGLILRVPSQNILVTWWHDMGAQLNGLMRPVRVMIPTTDYAKLPPFHKVATLTRSDDKPPENWIYNNPRELLTPDEVIRKTFGHNEIIVAVRPGVKIYPGFPPTAPLTVQGLFWKMNSRSIAGSIEKQREEWAEIAEEARGRWPMIEIP